MAFRGFEPITKGGKIRQNLVKAHTMRSDLDDFINAEARRFALKVRIFPMMDWLDTKGVDNSIQARKSSVGMTRILKNSHGEFQVEIRFNDDQLYLKTPSGISNVKDGFSFFKDRWVLYIQMEDDKPKRYAAPFKIADIPEMMRKSVDECFWISESESNSNRLNSSIYGNQMTWIGIGGMSSLFGRKPALPIVLAGLGAK